MIDNGDGTYTIQNTQTGESKRVSAADLQSYGLSAPQSQAKAPLLNTILQMGGGLLGANVGGGIGMDLGAGAGALVPGADATGVPELAGGATGAYTGAVTGAGIGSGAGNALADILRAGVLGDKTVNLGQTLPNSIGPAEQGAAGEAIGLPIAKGMGGLAHPIQPFIDMVDKTLANSPKTIDMSMANGILGQLKTQLLPQMTKDGFGPEAQATYDSLANRITGMVNSRIPHLAGDATQTGDISSMTLPIAAANGIKRDLYQLAKKTYGGVGNPGNTLTDLEQQGAAKAGNILKTAIGSAEPAVNLPNQIASGLYKVPETLGGLTNILSMGNPLAAKAIQTIDNLPKDVIQKIIPGNGGALTQILPRGLQFLFGQGQN